MATFGQASNLKSEIQQNDKHTDEKFSMASKNLNYFRIKFTIFEIFIQPTIIKKLQNEIKIKTNKC